jgi:hypothetical protein
LRGLLRLRSTPLWSSWAMNRCRLVGLGMYILRYGSIALVGCPSRCLPILQKLKASLDVYVGGIEIGCALVGVEGIGGLVVARLIQCSQIVPNL